MIQKVNYEVDENNKMIGYTIIPFDEKLPTIEIELDDVRLGFSTIIDGVFTSNKEVADNRKALRSELHSIESWLSANDYKIFKFILGEWTSETTKWIEYLAERKVKRARQNELQELLGE